MSRPRPQIEEAVIVVHGITGARGGAFPVGARVNVILVIHGLARRTDDFIGANVHIRSDQAILIGPEDAGIIGLRDGGTAPAIEQPPGLSR